jgi:intein/homing endonuclease
VTTATAAARSLHTDPPRTASVISRRLFDDLMAVEPAVRQAVYRDLAEEDMAQLLHVAQQAGGTPYALWRDDCPGFIEDVLGETMWSRSRRIMTALSEVDRVAVPSCFGSSKCVAYDERVMLADGRVVTAESLVGTEFEVLGWQPDGTQTVRRARAEWNRTEPVYRLTTASGRTVVRNGHHPLWAADNVRRIRSGGERGTVIRTPENIGWRGTADLRPGDLVLVPEHVDVRTTERLPHDQAALLGYLLGDGSMLREVRFSHLPGESLDEFIGCVERLGSVVKDYPSKGRHRELVVRGTGWHSNAVLDLVRSWGLLGYDCKTRALPDILWRLHPDDLAVVLGRLWACDGWATSGTSTKRTQSSAIGIGQSNEQVIRDLQRLLLRLGIPGTVRATWRSVNGKRFPHWTWTTTDAAAMRRFMERVDVPGKRDAIARAVEAAESRRHTHLWPHRNAPDGYRWEKVTTVEALPETRTVAIEVDDDHTWVDLLVEHNTWSTARSTLWFGATRAPGTALVVTIAPRFRQVQRQMWPEIRKAHGRSGMPGVVDMTQWKIRLDSGLEWVIAYGLSAPPYAEDAVQGIHAPELLLVVDEAGGIARTIGQNFRALLTGGAKMIAIGNPPTDDENSWFETFCGEDETTTIPIPATATPNFTAERAPRCRSCPPTVPAHSLAKHLVDPKWVRGAITEHGEEAPYVQAKVFARFPKGGASRTMPYSWVEVARERDEPDPGPGWHRLRDLGLEDEDREWLVHDGDWVRLGVDVAADGGDEFVIARTVGNLGTIEHRSSGIDNEDPMSVAGKVLEHIRRASLLRDRLGTAAPVRVKVDVIGVGWGVVGALQSWRAEGLHDAEIVAVDVRENAPEARQGIGETLRPWRQRDMMWLAGRDLLRPVGPGEPGRVRLRVDERVVAQLSGPTYGTNASGFTVIESKDHLKKRGLTSPDRAEAWLLSVFEPPQKPRKRVRLLA